jgi:hypothetical protein
MTTAQPTIDIAIIERQRFAYQMQGQPISAASIIPTPMAKPSDDIVLVVN